MLNQKNSVPFKVRSLSYHDTQQFQQKIQQINDNLPRFPSVKISPNKVRHLAIKMDLMRRQNSLNEDEEQNEMINQSFAIISPNRQEQSIFPTAPKIYSKSEYSCQKERHKHLFSLKLNRQRIEFTNDVLNLKALSKFYNNQLHQSMKQKLMNSVEISHRQMDEDQSISPQKSSRYIQKIQQEQKKEKIKAFSNVYVQKFEKKKIEPLFSKTVILFVVDIIQIGDKPIKSAFGINLQQYQQCCLRKNLYPFFDKEVAEMVFPLIKQIIDQKQENIEVPSGIQDRCNQIQNKEEFILFIRQLRDQDLDDILLHVIRYFFIPSFDYRQQLLSDLKDHINNLFKIYCAQKPTKGQPIQELKVNHLSTLNGKEITDFTQVDWNTQVLFAYSSYDVIYSKLPLIEQILSKFKNMKIEFEIENKEFSKKKKIDTKKIFKRAVSQMDKTHNVTNVFEFVAPRNIEIKQEKATNIMSRVLNVVKFSKQIQNGVISQTKLQKHFALSELEIQSILKEHSEYNHDDIERLSNEFSQLISQNEYFEVKNGLIRNEIEKFEYLDNSRKYTYLQLLIERDPILQQINIENPNNIQRVIRAADIKLNLKFGETQIIWLVYLHLKSILDLRANENVTSNFLKNYFDIEKQRRISQAKIDEILMNIPSQRLPHIFRVCFKEIIKHWFCLMNFYENQDADDFDSSIFMVSVKKYPNIIRYLLQWILGMYDEKFIQNHKKNPKKIQETPLEEKIQMK